jgi:hypothetical protein
LWQGFVHVDVSRMQPPQQNSKPAVVLAHVQVTLLLQMLPPGVDPRAWPTAPATASATSSPPFRIVLQRGNPTQIAALAEYFSPAPQYAFEFRLQSAGSTPTVDWHILFRQCFGFCNPLPSQRALVLVAATPGTASPSPSGDTSGGGGGTIRLFAVPTALQSELPRVREGGGGGGGQQVTVSRTLAGPSASPQIVASHPTHSREPLPVQIQVSQPPVQPQLIGNAAPPQQPGGAKPRLKVRVTPHQPTNVAASGEALPTGIIGQPAPVFSPSGRLPSDTPPHHVYR